MDIDRLEMYSQIYNKRDMYFTNKFANRKGRKDILKYCTEIINIADECIDGIENGNVDLLIDYFYHQCCKIQEKSKEIGALLDGDIRTWLIFSQRG